MNYLIMQSHAITRYCTFSHHDCYFMISTINTDILLLPLWNLFFFKSLTCITSLPGMESIYTFTQVLYLSSSNPNPKVLSYHYSTIPLTVKYCTLPVVTLTMLLLYLLLHFLLHVSGKYLIVTPWLWHQKNGNYSCS